MSDAPPALTLRQQTLIADGLRVVVRCAERMVFKTGRLLDLDDLISIGNLAVVDAARIYLDEYNDDFADFARRYVRTAMRDAIGGELFEERVKRAAQKAGGNFLGFLREDFNSMTISDDETRRRYRNIANGLLAATFTAGVEEAARSTRPEEAADRNEYAQAVAALRHAMQKLTPKELAVLAHVYRDLLNLHEAGEALGMPYGTIVRYHQRALFKLRRELSALGITRAPRPLDLPDMTGVLDVRGSPGNDPP